MGFEKKRMIEVERLHCTIPKELMQALKESGLICRIDNIVADFLYDLVEKEIRRGGGRADE